MAKDDGLRGAWWWIDRWRQSEAYIDFTLAQQGAYRNLLDELWLRGGVLPDDERTLARASGDPLEWPDMRDRVMSKFYRAEGGWRHSVVDQVMEKSRSLREERADAGMKGFAQVDRGPGGRFTGKHGQNAGKPTGERTGDSPLDETGKAPPIRTQDQVSGTRSQEPIVDHPRARDRSGEPDPKGFDRDALVLEAYRHIEVISRARNEDPSETLRRCSTIPGSGWYMLPRQLDTAKPEHLERTVIRLRDEARQCAPPPQASYLKPDAALADIAARKDELAEKFCLWWAAGEPTLSQGDAFVLWVKQEGISSPAAHGIIRAAIRDRKARAS